MTSYAIPATLLVCKLSHRQLAFSANAYSDLLAKVEAHYARFRRRPFATWRAAAELLDDLLATREVFASLKRRADLLCVIEQEFVRNFYPERLLQEDEF